MSKFFVRLTIFACLASVTHIRTAEAQEEYNLDINITFNGAVCAIKGKYTSNEQVCQAFIDATNNIPACRSQFILRMLREHYKQYDCPKAL